MKTSQLLIVISLVIIAVVIIALLPSETVKASHLYAVTLTPSGTPFVTRTLRPTRTPIDYPTREPRPTRTPRFTAVASETPAITDEGPSKTPKPSNTPGQVIVVADRPQPGGFGNAGVISFWVLIGSIFSAVMIFSGFLVVKLVGARIGINKKELVDRFTFIETTLHPDHQRAIVIIFITLAIAAIILGFITENFF